MDIQSINPNTEYKRWGGLAGVMEGMNSANIEAADQQQLLANLYKNQMDQVKARQALADDNDPTMEYWRQRGKIGEGMENYSKGAKSFGTLESDVDAGNAKNQAETIANNLKGKINTIDNIIALVDANGPAGLSMLQGRLPPELQMLAEKTGPAFTTVLSRYSDGLKRQLADTPTHRGAVDLKHIEGAYNLGAHAVTANSSEGNSKRQAATQIQLEQMRIDAGKYAAKNSDRLVLFRGLKPEVQLAEVNAALINGIDPVTKEPLDANGKAYWTMYGQSLGASAELKVPPVENKGNAGQFGIKPLNTPKAIVPGTPPAQVAPAKVYDPKTKTWK